MEQHIIVLIGRIHFLRTHDDKHNSEYGVHFSQLFPRLDVPVSYITRQVRLSLKSCESGVIMC